MKKKTLNKIINSLLFEADTIGMPNVTYGIYDRPGPKDESDPDFKPTVHPDVPLRPTELMSNQLAVERPPIEDENYAPTSVSDLKHAVAAVAGMVPPDQVQMFYKRSLELLDEMEEEEMSKKVEKPVQVAAEEESVKSESLRRRRRGLQALIEALGDEDLYSTRTGERLRSRYDPQYAKGMYHDEAEYSEYDTGVETEDTEATSMPAEPDDDKVLDQLAKQFGYKGASGMRQALHRLFELMKYLITQVGATKIEDMMGTVVPEFVDHATELGFFDKQDAVELMASPVHVRQLDTFRNYFNALYRPVYQKLRAEKEKEIREEILGLGVPKAALDSVYYQIAGTSARKDSTIAKKLASSMSPTKVKGTLETIAKNFDRLKKQMDQIPNNLLDLVHDRVDSLGDKKKQQMVVDAFRETASFKEQFGESRRRRTVRK